MDSGVTQMAMEMNFRIIKEPRGILRLLQLIFSIFAFATTSGFSTHFSYDVTCQGSEITTPPPQSILQTYSYPFRLNTLKQQICGNPVFFLSGDYSSQSQYFVASGVLAFLYCIGTLVLYILYDKLYQNNNLVPIADFGISIVMAVFWLSSSAAWAQGVGDLKYFANPTNFLIGQCLTATCVTTFSGNFATLNVSLMFGFLNFAVWACNLWFLYKETPWFINKNPQSVDPPQPRHM